MAHHANTLTTEFLRLDVLTDSHTPVRSKARLEDLSGYILDGWQPHQIRHAQLNNPATLDVTKMYFSIACYTIYFLFELNYSE